MRMHISESSFISCHVALYTLPPQPQLQVYMNVRKVFFSFHSTDCTCMVHSLVVIQCWEYACNLTLIDATACIGTCNGCRPGVYKIYEL